VTAPIEPTSRDSLLVTSRTRLSRHPERGAHERATIDAILDEALIGHLGVTLEHGPAVVPTAHVRIADAVYLHGARQNRVLMHAASGAPVCFTVSLLDGLVFARSAFHHSMNYRSVVLYGTPSEVTNLEEKRRALDSLLDHMAPGRSHETRPASENELRATLVVRLPITEGSAKIRSGPPLDAGEHDDGELWGGVLPLRTTVLPPRVDPLLPEGRALPKSVARRATELRHQLGQPYTRTRGGYELTTDPRRIDFEVVHRFLRDESYWARGVDAELQRRSMDHAVCFGIYSAEQQVGFARVISDFGRFAYLGDVFIVREERGRGLGKWLVECILAHPELRGVERWLLGTADAHTLYTRYGFEPVDERRYLVRRNQRSGGTAE
jgi:nitroimidazol reductase NimA-like FMN-containing flavoprotein (pyridoxamine 5'-phosphate oxidase superfamily)/GNAT superfamily N-acetyltransferase